jgi:hypothetical protein
MKYKMSVKDSLLFIPTFYNSLEQKFSEKQKKRNNYSQLKDIYFSAYFQISLKHLFIGKRTLSV